MAYWLNRVAKWRTVFAGWQLGTRAKGDPESDAVRDHRELTILMRAELSALVGVLVRRGVFTAQEWNEALEHEAQLLDADYARRFPGFASSEDGMVIDPQVAVRTTKGWRP